MPDYSLCCNNSDRTSATRVLPSSWSNKWHLACNRPSLSTDSLLTIKFHEMFNATSSVVVSIVSTSSDVLIYFLITHSLFNILTPRPSTKVLRHQHCIRWNNANLCGPPFSALFSGRNSSGRSVFFIFQPLPWLSNSPHCYPVVGNSRQQA